MTNSIAKSKSFVLLGIFLAVPLIFGINYAEAQSASQGEEGGVIANDVNATIITQVDPLQSDANDDPALNSENAGNSDGQQGQIDSSDYERGDDALLNNDSGRYYGHVRYHGNGNYDLRGNWHSKRGGNYGHRGNWHSKRDGNYGHNGHRRYQDDGYGHRGNWHSKRYSDKSARHYGHGNYDHRRSQRYDYDDNWQDMRGRHHRR